MKKILLTLIIIILYVIIFKEFNIKIYNKLPIQVKTIVLSLLSNDKTSKKITNDLKTKFLPETQLIDLNYKKIKLSGIDLEEFEVAHGMYAKTYKSFFLENFSEQIFLMSKSGLLFYFEEKNLLNDDLQFNTIKTNIIKKRDTILNFHISGENVYISIAKLVNDNCEKLQLKKGKLNLQEITFSSVINFDECLLPGQVGGGAIASFKKSGEEKILLSVSDYNVLNKNYNFSVTRAQNEKSIFGKILLIDPLKKTYENFSMGHRVALGLYSDLNGDIMLSVENGPKGGDEINKLVYKNNYGWNIASYGEEYGVKKQRQPSLFKSHSERNFTEPLFSYTPSIAPSSIIKLDNNFSPFWRDNFLMGTLIYGHLVRLKFDKNFDKLILNEPIYIGERIRDLVYIKKSKIILLALESTGSIGLLSLKN